MLLYNPDYTGKNQQALKQSVIIYKCSPLQRQNLHSQLLHFLFNVLLWSGQRQKPEKMLIDHLSNGRQANVCMFCLLESTDMDQVLILRGSWCYCSFFLLAPSFIVIQVFLHIWLNLVLTSMYTVTWPWEHTITYWHCRKNEWIAVINRHLTL